MFDLEKMKTEITIKTVLFAGTAGETEKVLYRRTYYLNICENMNETFQNAKEIIKFFVAVLLQNPDFEHAKQILHQDRLDYYLEWIMDRIYYHKTMKDGDRNIENCAIVESFDILKDNTPNLIPLTNGKMEHFIVTLKCYHDENPHIGNLSEKFFSNGVVTSLVTFPTMNNKRQRIQETLDLYKQNQCLFKTIDEMIFPGYSKL